jgi:glutaredoxin 3
VDSLSLPPTERDPDHVYVADVRKPGGDGRYPVKRYPRGWFEAQVDALAKAEAPAASGVTLYMASWCGACRSAAAYMRSRDVAFVEKDIEKDAVAAAEMRAKAQAAGKTPRGVPVIDFNGTLLMGFDKQKLASLIDQQKHTI